MTVQIVDFACVSCDGRRALVDFVVQCPWTGELVTIRVSHGPSHDGLVLEHAPAVATQGTVRGLLNSQEALDDVIEAIRYQRDLLREVS